MPYSFYNYNTSVCTNTCLASNSFSSQSIINVKRVWLKEIYETMYSRMDQVKFVEDSL